jgi:hypothetical protein
MLGGEECLMATAKGISGGILALVGLLWILQGLNVVRGSGMSGHPIYAVLGVVVLGIGLWLLQSVVRIRPGGQRP